jgi:dimethylaniline monooxygenase (N-oxide forming)
MERFLTSRSLTPFKSDDWKVSRLPAMSGQPRVCVIGAGSSGIAACQSLLEHRIDFVCFEKGSSIGGNWRYENDNGMSAAYKSLHINTSRQMMSYRKFPMPDHYPDYPDHFQIAEYFDRYADHFGLRDHIRFNTEVQHVDPVDGGGWTVRYADREGEERSELFTDVLVCNGHHWDPRWPEPAFPGSDTFKGTQMHAHDYRTPDIFEGKRTLVLGIGNSATDIAVESSRVAEATFLAMRRSAWVVPKYIAGMPSDRLTTGVMTRAPLALQSFLMGLVFRITAGKPTDYGLPQPDHKFMHAHPTVSGDLYARLGHGDIVVKPNIERLDGEEVEFTDGTREKIDIVVYCTGYKITFPFLDESVISTRDNQVDLYRRVAAIDRPGLYFIGLVQPLGSVMPLAEAQSEWVAEIIAGHGTLPDRATMAREVAREQSEMKRRYVKSKRHTIQVDFESYLRTVSRERERSKARAGSA